MEMSGGRQSDYGLFKILAFLLKLLNLWQCFLYFCNTNWKLGPISYIFSGYAPGRMPGITWVDEVLIIFQNAFSITYCFAYANSSCNPVLYAFMKDDVRVELSALVSDVFALVLYVWAGFIAKAKRSWFLEIIFRSKLKRTVFMKIWKDFGGID